MIDLDPDLFISTEILDGIRQEEEKRNLRKVRALSEFSAMYRSNIYEIMKDFILQFSGTLKPIVIKDYIIDHLYESIEALTVLLHISNPEQQKFDKTLLYRLVKYLEEILFPRGASIDSIYTQLLSKIDRYYECQRHLVQPHTYFREKQEDPDALLIPGMSPMVYKIINNITSLYNLNPNYINFPENLNHDIPVLIKKEIFDPYIHRIANTEHDAIESIAERIGLCIEKIFLAPQESTIKLFLTHDFFRTVTQKNGNIKFIPQFSNETLVLYYSAFASKRRGFLSKELVNWIAMNFALLIYMGVLNWKLDDENIFYPIFKDLQTNEKILPYLMKLICFPNYLGMDKMKIKDSVQHRKEIFNFLGSQIDNLKDLIEDVAKLCNSISKEKK